MTVPEDNTKTLKLKAQYQFFYVWLHLFIILEVRTESFVLNLLFTSALKLHQIWVKSGNIMPDSLTFLRWIFVPLFSIRPFMELICCTKLENIPLRDFAPMPHQKTVQTLLLRFPLYRHNELIWGIDLHISLNLCCRHFISLKF